MASVEKPLQVFFFAGEYEMRVLWGAWDHGEPWPWANNEKKKQSREWRSDWEHYPHFTEQPAEKEDEEKARS